MNPENRAKERIFHEMYDGFNDEIFRFCLSKTRNRDEALDITQETFIKTWDYMRNNKKIDSARAFLYRIARNAIIDYYRKKKPSSLDAMLDNETHHELPDPNVTPAGADLDRTELIHRLKQLPEHHYEILVLRFIQELTIAEISKILGESENTISVRIHRALKHAQTLFPEQTYE